MDVKELQAVNERRAGAVEAGAEGGVPAPRLRRRASDASARRHGPGACAGRVHAGGAHRRRSIEPSEGLLAVEVHKRREHYTIDGCMAELSEIGTEQGSRRTIAVESEDPALVIAAVRELGLRDPRNVCLARGLKAADRVRRVRLRGRSTSARTRSSSASASEARTGRGARSSTAPRSPGSARDSTRAGGCSEVPIARTAEAIAGMADEARSERRRGDRRRRHRRAADRARTARRFLDAVRERTGVEVEVISGEEEAGSHTSR